MREWAAVGSGRVVWPFGVRAGQMGWGGVHVNWGKVGQTWRCVAGRIEAWCGVRGTSTHMCSVATMTPLIAPTKGYSGTRRPGGGPESARRWSDRRSSRGFFSLRVAVHY